MAEWIWDAGELKRRTDVTHDVQEVLAEAQTRYLEKRDFALSAIDEINDYIDQLQELHDVLTAAGQPVPNVPSKKQMVNV